MMLHFSFFTACLFYLYFWLICSPTSPYISALSPLPVLPRFPLAPCVFFVLLTTTFSGTRKGTSQRQAAASLSLAIGADFNSLCKPCLPSPLGFTPALPSPADPRRYEMPSGPTVCLRLSALGAWVCPQNAGKMGAGRLSNCCRGQTQAASARRRKAAPWMRYCGRD